MQPSKWRPATAAEPPAAALVAESGPEDATSLHSSNIIHTHSDREDHSLIGYGSASICSLVIPDLGRAALQQLSSATHNKKKQNATI